MLVMFLDESGDHSLSVIDPQYPMFVLGGCIMDLEYHDDVAAQRVANYKKDLFGDEGVILHTADIIRRKGAFHKLTNVAFRDRFYAETNRLMAELDYMAVACAIKKDHHLKRYGLAALDPYMLSLKVLVERFIFEIKSRGVKSGMIVAESRDEALNNELRLAWMEIRTGGTAFLHASDVRKYLHAELHIRDKKTNIAGLQIADLIVSPIGRYALGKTPKQDWTVVERKLRKAPNGSYLGYGLVILPKKEKAAPE